MLVFIDESGDPGLKLEEGSSRYFTVSLVVFEENDEATACDQRIELLKRELGWAQNSEFHFKMNSDKARRAFLDAVIPYNFFYYGIVINKEPSKLWGNGFRDKMSFYKYACGLVFENAKDKLDEAIIVIDKSGNLDFRKQLERYLKTKINTEKKIIKKVKMQRSQSNNLLQLADYVAGAINRSINDKRKDSQIYRKMISRREIYVQVWPK
jgi:hypothetical protein